MEGELGSLLQEKNLIMGELGSLAMTHAAAGCGAAACSPSAGCNSLSFLTCMRRRRPPQLRPARLIGLLGS